MSEQLRLYLLLIPGVITVGVANLLGSTPTASGVAQIVLLLLFSAINISIALALSHFVLVLTGISLTIEEIRKKAQFLFAVLVISILNGFILTLGHENAWLNRLAHAVVGTESGVLTKQSNLSLLHELLLNSFGTTSSIPDGRDPDAYPPNKHETFLAHVHIKQSEEAFVGYRSRWSGAMEVNAIYLAPACSLRGEMAMPVDGAGVYVQLANVKAISFVDENSPVAACARRLRTGSQD